MAFAAAMKNENPALVRGENNDLAWATAGNACLDLFFKTVRGITSANLVPLLEASWLECPEATLRLIFQARDCRGGKGEKKIFYESLVWFYGKSPATVLHNLRHIPFYGTWKDLLALVELAPELKAPVAQLFATQLQEDLRALSVIGFNPSSDDKPTISLCAKWAPSEGHHHDEKTKLSKEIANLLYPNNPTALKLYRKDCLVPLRKQLNIIERFLCAKDWHHVPYACVPSRCMNINKKTFTKYDKDRFSAFLAAAMEGKTSVKGKQMFPHELVKQYMARSKKEQDLVIELQWNSILEPLKESGLLTSSVVLSDVSGSMSGIFMEVSIALGLLISELTVSLFKNLIITFESNPKFHDVRGETLYDRVKNVMNMAWGGDTNFTAALRLILDRAIANSVPNSEMPKKLFVISDMQFNQADSNYQTSHEYLTQEFRKAGYDVPLIIYWNVRANTVGFPVQGNTPGTCLLAGYSPSLLKLVLESDVQPGEQPQVSDMEVDGAPAAAAPSGPDPLEVMKTALRNERYDLLELVR